MAQVIISLKIMPENIEIDLESVEKCVKKEVVSKVGEGDMKTEIIPVAFGLKSLNVIFVMMENDKLDTIEASIKDISGVKSVEVIDVRRAIG